MHRNEWKWKHNNPKPVGYCKSSAKGKVHSNTGLPQETRKKSNKKPNSTPIKKLEKEEMKNHRVSRRKQILKIRAEITAKEIRDHSKNQQSQKLVLWEDKENLQTIS